MREDTLVILSSDNGPVWYETDNQRFGHESSGPLRGMKGDSYEGGHRVPFMVRWPGYAPAGATSEETICFTDLLATFAALVGLDVPDDSGEDSFNALPAFKGEKRDKPVRPSTVYKNGEVIRMGDWKLLTHLGSGGFSEPRRVRPVPGGPTGQLFNLRDDIGERHNLWSENPAIVERLSRELERVKTSVR